MNTEPLLWVCDGCTQGNGTELNSCVYCGAARPAICEYRRGVAPKDPRKLALGIGLELAGFVLITILVKSWPLVLGLGLIITGRDLYNAGKGR